MSSSTSDAALSGAAFLGTAAGLRAFTPPAVLARTGRLGTGRAATVVPLLALGELVGDKLPMVPARTSPPALAARAVSGGVAGQLAAGPQGALAGAACAVVAAHGGRHTRAWLGRVTGRPDVQLAILEDLLTVALAVRGARAASA